MWLFDFAFLLVYYCIGSFLFFCLAVPRAIAQRLVLCCRKKKPATRLEGTIPIVCVGGFLAPKRSPSDTWGCLEELDSSIIFPEISGVLSQHDRACELFYYIKGGRVDYGAEHSRKFGHNRYGESCAGAYPEWDAQVDTFSIHLLISSYV